MGNIITGFLSLGSNAEVVTGLLNLGRTLSTELAERNGAKVVQKAKTVVIDLTTQRSYCRKLRNSFCPQAKEPKLEIISNYTEGGANSISYKFKDGNIPLSGAGMTRQENGCLDFNFNVVNSGTHVEHISASGSYNPTQPFFDWNNCGETLERRFGSTIASIDSSGFAFRASVNNQSALSVLREIKAFFSSPAKQIT